jgi:hypothetical protein
MSERTKRLSRRNFLLAVGAGGAASAAAIVANNKPQEKQPVKGSGKRATRGYEISEHINNYYRTTKV